MIILVQTTKTEAEAQRDALNAQYTSSEIIGTHKAIVAQINNFAMDTIPTAREAEFLASGADKQNNFLQFSRTAREVQYAGTDFISAWETEYTKIYG